jgi:hypothetical protein
MSDPRGSRADRDTRESDGRPESAPHSQAESGPSGPDGSGDAEEASPDRVGDGDGTDAHADGTASETPPGFPGIDEAVADATVAAVAGGGTIALALVARVGLAGEVDVFAVLLPLLVYPAYKLADRFGPVPPLEGVRAWALIAAGVTLATLGWLLLG